MNGHYILNAAGEPIPEENILTWARWFDTHRLDRIIASTEVGEVTISTVFLGLDHSFGSGPPVLFETMIFGGALDETQERYTTRQAAIEGHAHYVALVEKDANADT